MLALAALTVVALASGACTRGNIVSDFEPPIYTIVDTLAGGVEVRRYDTRARTGEAAAERAVREPAGEIEAAATRSGLVAVARTSEGDQERLLAALEASPRWRVDGEPIMRTGGSTWGFLGLTRDEVAVPIRRTSDLSSWKRPRSPAIG